MNTQLVTPQPTVRIQKTVMNQTSRAHRSNAMYLLNEALARARCAESEPRRKSSRPAREVAILAARWRRQSR